MKHTKENIIKLLKARAISLLKGYKEREKAGDENYKLFKGGYMEILLLVEILEDKEMFNILAKYFIKEDK